MSLLDTLVHRVRPADGDPEGALVLLQGVVEIARCIVCLRTGQWPMRLKDAEEIDVIEQQLAKSIYVDVVARDTVIQQAKTIDESARKRGSEK